MLEYEFIPVPTPAHLTLDILTFLAPLRSGRTISDIVKYCSTLQYEAAATRSVLALLASERLLIESPFDPTRLTVPPFRKKVWFQDALGAFETWDVQILD